MELSVFELFISRERGELKEREKSVLNFPHNSETTDSKQNKRLCFSTAIRRERMQAMKERTKKKGGSKFDTGKK